MTPSNRLNLPPNPVFPRVLPASIAWHGAMAAGMALTPHWWPIWLGGTVANHAALCAASMLPRSHLLGPNITRLPADARRQHQLCLTFDDGPDPDMTPKVLDLLHTHDATASFFCIGTQIQKHGGLVHDIIDAGHSVENHTQTHHHRFAFRGAGGLHQEIKQAQEQITALDVPAPRFFRAPAGMRNPFLQTVLARQNLRLTSWTRRGFDTVEKQPNKVLQRLTRNLSAGDILLLHDGHGAKTADSRAVILDVLPELLKQIKSAGLRSVSLPMAFAQ